MIRHSIYLNKSSNTGKPLPSAGFRAHEALRRCAGLFGAVVCADCLLCSPPPAYIPTPIYFGAVIDTTCMLWQQECGVQGSCWEYNVTSFRFVYFGLAAGLKFVGFVFIFLAWYSIKYKEDALQRQRWREFPLGTVSELVGAPEGGDKYARTRSCPAFGNQGDFHEEGQLRKGFQCTAQTYPGPFPEAIRSSPDPGLEESPTAV